MQIPTHILSGWCFANLFHLTARQRLCCMIAASIADLDGLGILVGPNYYLQYHHTFGHNLAAAAFYSLILTLLSAAKAPVAALYFLLYLLHLLLDAFGSGVGWGLNYFWPIDATRYVNPYAWQFQGWQNVLALTFFALWALVIARRKHRTPFEVLS